MYTYVLKTIEALKDDFPLKQVRLLIHEADEASPKPQKASGGNGGKQSLYGGSTTIYTLEGDMILTPRHLTSVEDLRREPWFFHPYTTSASSSAGSSGSRDDVAKEIAKNFFKAGHLPTSAVEGNMSSSASRSHYHRNKMMDAQMFGDSYFTWPYFDCKAHRIQEQQQQQQQQLRARANYYYRRRQLSRRDLFFFAHVDQGQKRPEELVRKANNGANSHYHHNDNIEENNKEDKNPSTNHTHTWLASYTAWFPIGGLKENKRSVYNIFCKSKLNLNCHFRPKPPLFAFLLINSQHVVY